MQHIIDFVVDAFVGCDNPKDLSTHTLVFKDRDEAHRAATAVAHKKTTLVGFFDIPAELRNQIYDEVLPGDLGIRNDSVSLRRLCLNLIHQTETLPNAATLVFTGWQVRVTPSHGHQSEFCGL